MEKEQCNMNSEKIEKPYHIGGIHPIVFSCLTIILIGLSSVMGYVLGLSNNNNPPETKVEVMLKTDSALMEVIRSQVKIEMEMLKVINNNTNKAPTVNNIIRPKLVDCIPQIVNSFNKSEICKDSLSH